MAAGSIRRSPQVVALFLTLAAAAPATRAATFSVNDTADAVDASIADGVCATAAGTCTLRAAIQEANSQPGLDTVVVPSGTYTLAIAGADNTAAAGDLDVTQPLRIVGAGARTTLIDGGGIDRVFDGVGSAPLSISDVTIRNGTTASNEDGGGVASGNGALVLLNVTLTGNTAMRDGGAVYNAGGSLTFTNVTIQGNSAVNGGGIATQGGGAVMTNVTISGNTASASGGGLYKQAGGMTLTNLTVTGNSSAGGGGVYKAGGGDTVLNTIIAGNTAGGDCGSALGSAGNNLDGDGTCGFSAAGDLSGVSPLLGPLQDNGGGTDTQALLPGSPAIDAGTNTGCPATDQRGFARPVDGDGDSTTVCDMGAYEAAASLAPAGPILLAKEAGVREVEVGEALAYTITATNGTATAAAGLTLRDAPPLGFKFVEGSARLVRAGLDTVLGTGDDLIAALPAAGGGPILFGPFDLAAGESAQARYVMRVGSGAQPGERRNRAAPYQGTVAVGSEAEAGVLVTLEQTFDLSTVIGKVYEDRNRNDWQDPDEPGVSGAMVALDDGTYALTDAHGRYHFPAVKPGHRLVKLNLHSLPAGATATGDDDRILWITPGLTAKASFGVLIERQPETIGSPAQPGLELVAAAPPKPVEVVGSAGAMALVVEGGSIPLPAVDVRLQSAGGEEAVRIAGDDLEAPIRFDTTVSSDARVEDWVLVIESDRGEEFNALAGTGPPAQSLPWDGKGRTGALLRPGEIYRYQLRVRFAGGMEVSSPWRRISVGRSTVLSVQLTGEAFEAGRAELSAEAKRVLEQAAETVRRAVGGRLVIEGHTDATGATAFNLDLSRRRAEAARDYLIGALGFQMDRIDVRWYGEDRPVAPNDTPEGRTLNRRVEIRGEARRVESTEILDQHRQPPRVRLNEREVETDAAGRFAARLEEPGAQPIRVEMVDAYGASARATLALPRVEIAAPLGRYLLPYGGQDRECSAAPEGEAPPGPGRPIVATCRLEGRTDPRNAIEIDGGHREADASGVFTGSLPLREGDNTFAVLARSPGGLPRIVNLRVHVSDRDAEGRRIIVADAVPHLTVHLPPAGSRLTSLSLPISGSTDPGNQVSVNGRMVEINPAGEFSVRVELAAEKPELVVEVRDPEGRVGRIERLFEQARNQVFLVAIADGRFGSLGGDGAFEAAGVGEKGSFSEGRAAFYLKGRIAGRYLVTSAFDSDKDQVEGLFKDLDVEQTRRLLTNLDPDKLYPVYGDASTVGYDGESREKLYLAVESEEMHFLVGNYPISLTGTELATYQRTLYGSRLAYESAERTRYGDPLRQLTLFAADLKQTHVRDELRATGGSLYYLSHRDVIEGSEEVTLVVRDQHTGLLLSRERQRQSLDYTIKYEEGRLMFQRPVSSVSPDDSLVNAATLSGHEVFLHVDYEARLESFEKTASGGRGRQQLGDQFALGWTYVKDELGAGRYEMAALDTELRLGARSRLTAEIADSDGVDSLVSVSDDGGITYTQAPATTTEHGDAYKVGADLDLGEWFDRPDRYRLRLYWKELGTGFFTSGNLLEQGSRKAGLNADLKLTQTDSLHVRLNQEQRLDAVAPGAVQESTVASMQWDHLRERWGVQVELFENEGEDALGRTLDRSRLGATRLWTKVTEKLTTRVERQQTLSGTDNNQSTLDVEYQVLPGLTLAARGTHGSSGDAVQGGIIAKAGRSEIYLTERLADNAAGEQAATVLGVRSPLGPGSRVYSEYQWEDRGGSGRTVSLMGLQQQWDMGPGFRFVLAGEAANVDSGALERRRSAATATLSYSNGKALTALTRNQLRFDTGTERLRQLVTFNQVEWKPDEDFTLFAKYRYSLSEDRDTGETEARLEERTVGVAFRPVAHDRFNALGRYTRLLDLNPLGTGGGDPPGSNLDVLAMELLVDLRHGLQWVTKGAASVRKQQFPGIEPVETTSYLAVQRLNAEVWRKLALGTEFRLRVQDESADRSQGWLLEAMWSLHRHFRAGLGYNFTDFSDSEFSNNDYAARGWFVRVQGKY